MPNRRLIRFTHLAPTGRRITVEEVPDRPCARIRWWSARDGRTITRVLTMAPRDSSGRITPVHRAQLAAAASAVVEAHEASQTPSAPVRHGTVGEALDFALDPITGKKHAPNSTQPTEWRRAREEALIVLAPTAPLNTLSASASVLVSSSALLRQLAGCSIPEWRAHVEQARQKSPRTAMSVEVLMQAYRAANARTTGDADQTLAWAVRASQIVRAMLRHAADREPDIMGLGRRFTIAQDLKEHLMTSARDLGRGISTRPKQERAPVDATLKLMRYLSDPRQRVHSLLATAVGDVATVRVRRSHLGRTADGALCVRPTKTDGTVPRVGKSLAGWKYLATAGATRMFDALVARWYATQEAAYQADPEHNDYTFLNGYEWDGTNLLVSREASWEWVDPRLRLLLILGAEGRVLQYLRLCVSDIELTESEHLMIRSQGEGKKRMSDLLLCDEQAGWLAFEQQCGYLSTLHAEWKAGRIPNYPLFSATRLVAGRLPEGTELQPQMDDKPFSGMNEKLLETLKVAKLPDVNLRLWRRVFADLYRVWQVPTAVHEVVTGHDPINVSGVVRRHSDALRATSSLRVYLDPAEETLLLRAARLLQHTRATYAATGAPCPPLD